MTTKQFSFTTGVYACIVMLVIGIFSSVILTENAYTDRPSYSYGSQLVSANAEFVNNANETNPSIDATSLVVVADREANGNAISPNNMIVEYTVQHGDSLSEIARSYSTTVDALMKANNLTNSAIRVGQKLYIASVEGIIYTLTNKTNPMVFCNQYSLDLGDFMSANGFHNKMRILYEGEEVFLPNVTRGEAIEKGLLEKPKPQPKPEPKPILTTTTTPQASGPRSVIKPSYTTQPTTPSTYTAPVSTRTSTNNTSNINNSSDNTKKYKDQILSQRVDTHRTSNGFAACNCTEQASERSTRLFPRPYKNQNRQYRTIHGDAKNRYPNAINVGLHVSSTPSVGAIIVFGPTGSNPYGHVGVVQSVDYKNHTITIKEQNFIGRCIVNTRLIHMTSDMTQARLHNIKGFIPVQSLPQYIQDRVSEIRDNNS